METLAELLEAGTLTPVIDRAFPLEQVRDAMRHLVRGHARGRILLVP